MYELYTFNRNYSTWSMRPWLALKVAGIPFKEHAHLLDTPDLKQIVSVSPSSCAFR